MSACYKRDTSIPTFFLFSVDDGQEGTDGPEAGKEGRDGGREVIDPGARDER